MSNSKDDPRDSSLEVKYTWPKTWYQTSDDAFTSSGMFLNGLIIVTRNRVLAWPSVLFAVNSLVNAHPLRAKEGGANSLSSIVLCASALFAAYFPMFVINEPAATAA